jgi:death-on-curing protein
MIEQSQRQEKGTLMRVRMASLHYLTVQDILWINLQVTKKVHHFNYARLEEATFYQYAYGESNTLLPQAARFVGGFVKMRPFEAGNEATALVAFLAFLGINGYTSRATGDDLLSWFRSGVTDVEKMAVPDEEGHHTIVPDVRSAVRKVMQRYAEPISELVEQSARQTA